MGRKKLKLSVVQILNAPLKVLFENSKEGNNQVFHKCKGITYSLCDTQTIDFLDMAILSAVNSLYIQKNSGNKIAYEQILKILTGNCKYRMREKGASDRNTLDLVTLKDRLLKLNECILTISKEENVMEGTLLNISFMERHFILLEEPFLLRMISNDMLDFEYREFDLSLLTTKKNGPKHESIESISTKFMILSKCILMEQECKIHIKSLKTEFGLEERQRKTEIWFKKKVITSEQYYGNIKREKAKFNGFLEDLLEGMVNAGYITSYKKDSLNVTLFK